MPFRVQRDRAFLGGAGEILEWLLVGFSRDGFEARGKFYLERTAGRGLDDGWCL